MKDISKRIKELREEKNISQAELAEKLFVTRQAVSNWETKKTRPDIETLEAMSKIFEVDMTEFLYGSEKDENEHRRRIIQIYVFGSCFILAVLMHLFVLPELRDVGIGYYITLPYTLASIVLAALYGFTVPLVLSVLSLSTDIYVKNVKVRKVLLAIGIILIAVYTGSLLYCFFVRFIIEIPYFDIPAMRFLKIDYFMMIGTLLYLGTKKGKRR